MVTPVQVLGELARCGVSVRRDGGDLVVFPVEAVGEELAATVKAMKPELLAALAESEPLSWPEPAAERCAWCVAAEAQGVRVLYCATCRHHHGPGDSQQPAEQLALTAGRR